jgi:hypothetical protein
VTGCILLTCSPERIECSRVTVESSIGTHFVLAPGHEDEPRETVVPRTDRFVVAESFGDGRAVALRTDPRRTPDR